jgi:RHS repeat-associated protein
MNGDGKADFMGVRPYPSDGSNRVMLHSGISSGPSDLMFTATNSLGGKTTIDYAPSTTYQNSYLPFPVNTVSAIAVDDGRGNVTVNRYSYAGGLYSIPDREFWGFRDVYGFQMYDGTTYESMTQTTFHQDAFLKGLVQRQTVSSHDNQSRTVMNGWRDYNLGSDAHFPELLWTATLITDTVGSNVYSYAQQTAYEEYNYIVLKPTKEHRFGNGAATSAPDVYTHYIYNLQGKPTDIKVASDGAGNVIQSRKWIDYYANGLVHREEICRTDAQAGRCQERDANNNPITSYAYHPEGNVWTITAPNDCPTTMAYDATKTFVHTKTGCTVGAFTPATTTTYDTRSGKLLNTIPPHLQGTGYSFSYTYDGFFRLSHEYRPDGGETSYTYADIGSPTTQYVLKQESIVNGSASHDQYAWTFFDGLGRTRSSQTNGAGGTIAVDTAYDVIGRVAATSNPYFSDVSPGSAPTRFWTETVYDGLSRVKHILTTDDFTVTTTYKGDTKEVTDQRGHATASTYDSLQRLRKVKDAYNTETHYTYDILGNLTQVTAAVGRTEQNITTMKYNSLSQKIEMNDPDMSIPGQPWIYKYDKSGNLICQVDAKLQTIGFTYDFFNRVTRKNYYGTGVTCENYQGSTPTRYVDYMYDAYDPNYACSGNANYVRGMLTKVSYLSDSLQKDDAVCSVDVMQRVLQSKKRIGSNVVPVAKTYDTAGRTYTLTYFPSDATKRKIITYEYNNAGNLLRAKDTTSGSKTLVEYSNFSFWNKPLTVTYPKTSPVSVITTYQYNDLTGRLSQLLTQKYSGGTLTETLQSLTYGYDGKGNVTTLNDTVVNNVSHTYEYDNLDRLLSAAGSGAGGYPAQTYTYDAIGNIMSKSDVGSYTYDARNPDNSRKPHAVSRTSGVKTIALTYDNNGNMVSRINSTDGITLTVSWNEDNKPTSIVRTGYLPKTVGYGYDGNGRRVKKAGNVTTYYFGEIYEERDGTRIYHVFAGSARIISLRSDGKDQTYHPNQLGSASMITDNNGDKKQKIEYFPYGTLRATVPPATASTYDYDATFPNVNYTFTDQEDDDELGLYNFKARLYDPELGRFISADSIVPEPGNLQAYNRYSYCVNNPLIYVDPSGNFFIIDDLIVIGICMAIGALMAGKQSDWNLSAMAVGAVIGGISAGVGIAVGGMFISPLTGAIVGGAAGGATGGGLNAAYYGGNIGAGMLKGAAFGAVAGGLMYGASKLAGYGETGTNSANAAGDPSPNSADPYNEPGTTSVCERPLDLPVKGNNVVGNSIYTVTGGRGHEFVWFGMGYDSAGNSLSYGKGLSPDGWVTETSLGASPNCSIYSTDSVFQARLIGTFSRPAPTYSGVNAFGTNCYGLVAQAIRSANGVPPWMNYLPGFAASLNVDQH